MWCCAWWAAEGARRRRLPTPPLAKNNAAAPSNTHQQKNTRKDSAPPLVAVEGDVVSLHFTCKGPDGAVLESTRSADEPLTFEVGAGEVMGNPLFQAFDGAIRGLAVGQEAVIEAEGGEWDKELLFSVPREHPEVTRLEGRYKNHGGLTAGMLVELANGSMALVMSADGEAVTLDANPMMAGKKLTFELELLSISRA